MLDALGQKYIFAREHPQRVGGDARIAGDDALCLQPKDAGVLCRRHADRSGQTAERERLGKQVPRREPRDRDGVAARILAHHVRRARLDQAEARTRLPSAQQYLAAGILPPDRTQGGERRLGILDPRKEGRAQRRGERGRRAPRGLFSL